MTNISASSTLTHKMRPQLTRPSTFFSHIFATKRSVRSQDILRTFSSIIMTIKGVIHHLFCTGHEDRR